MLINLKNTAAKGDWEEVSLEIKERLPHHLNSPCLIKCRFLLEKRNQYFLLRLMVESQLTIICQRCLNEFQYFYQNSSELALCPTDEIAEQVMHEYEPIVISQQVDLLEILTDELILCAPEYHAKLEDCGQEIQQFMHLDS